MPVKDKWKPFSVAVGMLVGVSSAASEIRSPLWQISGFSGACGNAHSFAQRLRPYDTREEATRAALAAWRAAGCDTSTPLIRGEMPTYQILPGPSDNDVITISAYCSAPLRAKGSIFQDLGDCWRKPSIVKKQSSTRAVGRLSDRSRGPARQTTSR